VPNPKRECKVLAGQWGLAKEKPKKKVVFKKMKLICSKIQNS